MYKTVRRIEIPAGMKRTRRESVSPSLSPITFLFSVRLIVASHIITCTTVPSVLFIASLCSRCSFSFFTQRAARPGCRLRWYPNAIIRYIREPGKIVSFRVMKIGYNALPFCFRWNQSASGVRRKKRRDARKWDMQISEGEWWEIKSIRVCSKVNGTIRTLCVFIGLAVC